MLLLYLLSGFTFSSRLLGGLLSSRKSPCSRFCLPPVLGRSFGRVLSFSVKKRSFFDYGQLITVLTKQTVKNHCILSKRYCQQFVKTDA